MSTDSPLNIFSTPSTTQTRNTSPKIIIWDEPLSFLLVILIRSMARFQLYRHGFPWILFLLSCLQTESPHDSLSNQSERGSEVIDRECRECAFGSGISIKSEELNIVSASREILNQLLNRRLDNDLPQSTSY